MEYVVVWRWRDHDDSDRRRMDQVEATNAQRAINKVKKAMMSVLSGTVRKFMAGISFERVGAPEQHWSCLRFRKWSFSLTRINRFTEFRLTHEVEDGLVRATLILDLRRGYY